MSIRLDRRLDRRQFLERTALGAFAVSRLGTRLDAKAAVAEDPPNTHNMLVVGDRKIFLSHLPMFDGLDKSKAAFQSPHRYQLIVEATFTNDGKDVGHLYAKDRLANPGTRIYTLNPETFVITRLFMPEGKPRLTEFSATIFRGHLENGGKPIRGLEKTHVTATRIVHGRMFDPHATKPAALEYILFGTGTELYLAHAIFGPPDFDHVLSIKLAGHQLTDADLGKGVRVVFQDRKNVADERLREEQRVPAMLRVGSASSASKVEVEGGVEFYFEEGELLMPPTFDRTAEEKKK